MQSGSGALQLSDDLQSDVDAVLDQVRSDVRSAVGQEASVTHVGATSIPGLLTKGDVDVVVHTTSEQFPLFKEALREHFKQNDLSVDNNRFSAFEAQIRGFDVGIQLVLTGGDFDVFGAFRRALMSNKELREAYNEMKRQYFDEGDTVYRAQKREFIKGVIGELAK